ncbi:hypothetical protein [Niallia taxi]|uniref:hypothetical protein n=1 Tax=Niallia taxi TaxID=2499688 RepID=UPI0015F680CA|nr:hypothetical protein [Niallia taxi]
MLRTEKGSNVVSILDIYRRKTTKTIKYPVIKEKGVLREVAHELRAVPEEYACLDHEIKSVLMLAAAYDEASDLPGIVTDKTILKLFQKQLFISRIEQIKNEATKVHGLWIEPLLRNLMIDMLERAIKNIEVELGVIGVNKV